MASHSFSRALRSSLTRQLTSPAIQRRTLISALRYARTGLAAPLKPASVASFQQTRGVKTIDFAGTKEVVYGDHLPCKSGPMADADGSAEREDWPREKLLVWLSQASPLGLTSAEPRQVVRVSDCTHRNTSKTIPLPSSATAHKDTDKA